MSLSLETGIPMNRQIRLIIFITVMTLLRFVVRRMWMIRSICLTTRQDGFCVIGSF